MSVLDKQSFVESVGKRLGGVLTVNQLQEVTTILDDELIKYDLESSACSEEHDFDDVLNLFYDAKRIEGCSEKTIAHYRYVLKRMRESMTVSLLNITVFHLRAYLMQEKDRGIADRTIVGYRDIFCSFFGWAYKEELISKDPTANLNKIKCLKKVKTPFNDVELEKLKSSCDNARDRAIIFFLLTTGCRISEVCSLNKDDLDFSNLECTVLGKGNKERVVYFDEVTQMVVQEYLSTRTDHESALFIGKGNRRLLPGGVRAMLNVIGDKAGVEHVHPHRFRRTFATNLIHRGMTVQEVAKLLGHENINTTMTYIYVDKINVKYSYQRHI